MSQISKPSVSVVVGAVNSVTGTHGVTAAPTTGNVVVSGVNATTSSVGVASFDPLDFTVSVTGEVSLLGSFVINTPIITGVDYTVVQTIPIYTPTSDFIASSIVNIFDVVVGSLGGLTFTVGTNAPNYDNIINSVTPTPSNGTYSQTSLFLGTPIPIITSGTTIYINILSGDVATTDTGRVFLTGSNI